MSGQDRPSHRHQRLLLAVIAATCAAGPVSAEPFAGAAHDSRPAQKRAVPDSVASDARCRDAADRHYAAIRSETHTARYLTIDAREPRIELAGDYVDRSSLANVLRERRALELLRLWETPAFRLYFGVGPTGLAGLNITQRGRPARRSEPEPTPDYARLIEALTARSIAVEPRGSFEASP